MKIFRFMSKQEFDKYINGEILTNETIHLAKTNSIGFCFFDFKKISPEEASNFVSGIVNMEICAVFETEEKYLKESYGIYHNPKYIARSFLEAVASYNDLKQRMTIKEYCTKKYSSKNFKLIKYTEDVLIQHFFGNRNCFDWKEI